MEHEYRVEDPGLLAARVVERVTRCVILAIGIICFFYGKISWITGGPEPLEIVLASILAPVFLAFYVGLLWGCPPRAGLVVTGVSALTLAVALGGFWACLIAAYSGLLVLFLPLSCGWPIAALATTVTACSLMVQHAPGMDVVTFIFSTCLYSGIYYLVGTLGRHCQAILRTRAELARTAVLEERLRFSRELHDILGHSLSVISVKTELAMRLLDRDPEAARGAVSSVSDLSRRSIADVRQVVRGYRMCSLATEIAGAEAVLAAMGVQVVADEVPAELPPATQEIFCWVVRAAATNILQHAHARFCSLELSVDGGWAQLRITNDGVISGSVGGGNGLTGLRQRLSDVGGTLTHDHGPDGTFSLRAAAPLSRPGEIACLSGLSSPRTKP